jgi:hypothetical protein
MAWPVEAKQAMVPEIPNPRSKAEPEQMTKRKDVICIPGRICIMLLNLQIGAMVEQAVENVCGIPNGGANGLCVKGRVTVGEVGVNHGDWIATVLGVHICNGGFLKSNGERLSI